MFVLRHSSTADREAAIAREKEVADLEAAKRLSEISSSAAKVAFM